MPDLDDFYVFEMISSEGGNAEKNTTGSGCSTVLIVLAVIGWVLWFVGKLL